MAVDYVLEAGDGDYERFAGRLWNQRMRAGDPAYAAEDPPLPIEMRQPEVRDRFLQRAGLLGPLALTSWAGLRPEIITSS